MALVSGCLWDVPIYVTQFVFRDFFFFGKMISADRVPHFLIHLSWNRADERRQIYRQQIGVGSGSVFPVGSCECWRLVSCLYTKENRKIRCKSLRHSFFFLHIIFTFFFFYVVTVVWFYLQKQKHMNHWMLSSLLKMQSDRKLSGQKNAMSNNIETYWMITQSFTMLR